MRIPVFLAAAAAVLGVALWLMVRESRSVVPQDDMKVHFIDVGQGGAVLIEKGNLRILYDCGESSAGSVVNAYLDRLGISALDMLVPSHAHDDHMGGCVDVLAQKSVTRVYHNGSQAPTKAWREFLRAARAADQVIVVEQDFSVDGVEFMVAYDSRGARYDYGDEADNSIVVRITAGGVRLLLTGDCETRCEREVAQHSDVRADILGVGHHGSHESSSAQFLAEVQPRIAVIQAGAGNPYRHPRPEALARLASAGAAIYRTDQAGTVVVRTDGEAMSVITER